MATGYLGPDSKRQEDRSASEKRPQPSVEFNCRVDVGMSRIIVVAAGDHLHTSTEAGAGIEAK
jgi:hypothetical protein